MPLPCIVRFDSRIEIALKERRLITNGIVSHILEEIAINLVSPQFVRDAGLYGFCLRNIYGVIRALVSS